MRIGLTSIYVDDQDQAEQFYTQVLGFQVKTSAPYGPGERWLSVVAPEDPDGLELVLHLADEPARAFHLRCVAAAGLTPWTLTGVGLGGPATPDDPSREDGSDGHKAAAAEGLGWSREQQGPGDNEVLAGDADPPTTCWTPRWPGLGKVDITRAEAT